MKHFAIAVFLLSISLTMIQGCGDEGKELGVRTIDVPLSYISNSNWGPEDATGKAVIDTTTGMVDISVNGLPILDEDRYEGWLAGGGESPLSTGVFNTDEDGSGESTITLGNLSERKFDLVTITVEPFPDPSPDPDSRHTIGGMIAED